MRHIHKNDIRILLFLILPCTFLLINSANATLQENLPLEHWTYSIIDELLLRGYGSNLLFSNRPYTRGDVAKLVLEIEEKLRQKTGNEKTTLNEWNRLLGREFLTEINELRATESDELIDCHISVGADMFGSKTEEDIELEPAFSEIRRGDEGDPHLRIILPLGYSISFGKYLTVSEIVWIDTETRNDPTARVKADPKRPLRFRSAYLKYSRPHLVVQIGRERFKWGPGQSGGLVLSNTSPSFDSFMFKLNAKWFTLTSMVFQLNDEVSSIGEDTGELPEKGIVNRYFYGHRLDMQFLSWLELGISETAVVSGVGRGFDLRFMNPFTSIWSTQNEGDRDPKEVNLSHSLNWVISYLPQTTIYGELLIDEIVLKERPAELPPQPNIIAFLQGIAITDPFGMYGTTVRAEYVRLNSFMYIHRGLNTDSEHFGAPIGHPFGPDTDQTSISITKILNPYLTMNGSISYRRRGEIRIDTEEESAGKTSSFLQGIVERRSIYSITATYLPSKDIFLNISTSFINVGNMEHIAGNSRSLFDLSFRISYYLNWS